MNTLTPAQPLDSRFRGNDGPESWGNFEEPMDWGRGRISSVPTVGASTRDGVQPSVMRISLSLGMIMGVTR